MLPIVAGKATTNRENQPLVGELLDAEDEHRWRLRRRLRDVSHWLDTAFEIPGLGWRFGLDPIIGMVPVAGDLTATVLSLYILAAAVRLGAPRSTLARMGLNIVIDNTLGSIPLVGNVFDFVWKANSRNMQLLERTLEASPTDRRRQSRGDWLFVGGVFAALAATFLGTLLLAVLAGAWIASRLAGIFG